MFKKVEIAELLKSFSDIEANDRIRRKERLNRPTSHFETKETQTASSLDKDGIKQPKGTLKEYFLNNSHPEFKNNWIYNNFMQQKWDSKPASPFEEVWPLPAGTKDTAPDSNIEKDPNGKSMNSPGAKADSGKVRVNLCLAGFAHALEEVAKVTTVGANKYTPNGWVDVPDGYNRYMDAFGRHYLDHSKGKEFDDGPGGTGCYHMAQMIWNLLAAFELQLTAMKNDKN